MLRTYPTNSPEAAGRVLAMALFSDGNCSAVELDTLQHLKAAERLGLTHDALKEVIHGFEQDMLSTTPGRRMTFPRIDEPTRDALLDDITDAYLQTELETLTSEVVVSDGHLADGEVELVNTLWARWHSHHINIGTGDSRS